MIRKILRAIVFFAAGLVVLVVIYGLSAFCLSRITVNDDAVAKNDVKIYILTNGVHTDILIPVKNTCKDWSREIRFENTAGKDSVAEYLAFGWGDRGFYLETPTWADLKISTAASAAFALGESAMHTTFYKQVRESNTCKAIDVSFSDYSKLVAYIESSFKRNQDGSPIHIVTNANYGSEDAFYEGSGSYSLFKTCNTWTNSALKASNQKASLWTPLDSGIFYHYAD